MRECDVTLQGLLGLCHQIIKTNYLFMSKLKVWEALAPANRLRRSARLVSLHDGSSQSFEDEDTQMCFVFAQSVSFSDVHALF